MGSLLDYNKRGRSCVLSNWSIWTKHSSLVCGGTRAFRRLQEAIIQSSEDHSILAWKNIYGDKRDRYDASHPLAPSPAYFSLFPVPNPNYCGLGYPTLSVVTGGIQIIVQLGKLELRNGNRQCLAWLDCNGGTGDGCYRFAIRLQYYLQSQRYVRLPEHDPITVPAPFEAKREMITLTDLDRSGHLVTAKPIFFLQMGGAPENHGFQQNRIFPKTKWIPKAQIIEGFNIGDGDWGLGIEFTALHPQNHPNFSIIVGYTPFALPLKPWCTIVPSAKQTLNLEEMVRRLCKHVKDSETAIHRRMHGGNEVELLHDKRILRGTLVRVREKVKKNFGERDDYVATCI
jgi:hypothetical protein